MLGGIGGLLVVAGVVAITMDMRSSSSPEPSSDAEASVSEAVSIGRGCEANRITGENLVSQMYKPILGLAQDDKIRAWKRTGLPRRMWGVSYQ